MEMKQLLVENATTEDFLRVKETFEKCIQALIPEINRFIYIREEKFEALTSYVKKLVTDELIASGEFVVEDTIKSLDPKESVPEKYQAYMTRLIGIIGKIMIILESPDTHYKWLSVISKSQHAASLIELEDKNLMIAFTNTARTVKDLKMTLHVPSEERQDKLQAIDFHYSPENDITFTSCKLGAPVMEVYLETTVNQEDPETKEIKPVDGVHVITVAYGDPGSMYHDIVLQLADLSSFKKMSVTVRRYMEDNPQLVEVQSLEELKNAVFSMQDEMNWYGVIESSQTQK
jgi:hypothetical protein